MAPSSQSDLALSIARSRDEFLAAFEGVSEEIARKQPAPGKWSACEIAEHLAVAQNGMLKRLREAETTGAPAHDPEKEVHFRALLTDRSTARPAPPLTHPTGRYGDLAATLAAFREATNHAIQFVEQCPSLLELRTEHPVFGVMNGRSTALILCEHPRRHTQQVRETLAQVS